MACRRTPFCCLWSAVDGDGRLRIYRELYERGKRAANSTASCIFRDTDAEVAAIRTAPSRNDAGATSSSAIRRASL